MGRGRPAVFTEVLKLPIQTLEMLAGKKRTEAAKMLGISLSTWKKSHSELSRLYPDRFKVKKDCRPRNRRGGRPIALNLSRQAIEDFCDLDDATLQNKYNLTHRQSVQSVRRRLERLGLVPKRSELRSDARKWLYESVKSARLSGKTYKEIANSLDITLSSVRWIIEKMGLKSKKRGRPVSF